jgi:hypothetical protein
MFRKALLTVAAIMAVAVLNSTAKADSITLQQGESTTFNFIVTGPAYAGASATATVTLSGDQLILSVTNTSTDTNVRLKGIGLNTSPNLSLSNFTATGGMSGFSFSSGGGGLGNMEAIASSTGNNTLNAGQTGTVVFTLNSTPQSLTIDQIIVHLIALPNDRSVKVTGTPGSVPEPMTMLLFGTGLAGIAARARRRRGSKA